jgi:protein phosphatase
MGKFIVANCTDVGKVRQVNEDSLVTFESQNGRVVVVCDGMGGQAAGDVASQLACNIIRDILENNVFSSPFEAITRSMVAANQGILHRVSQNPELEGMGATCVMLIIKDDKVYYGWVGDSRIYYISNHTIRQLSKDQSYVQTLVDSGVITAEEAENHPQKNEIINALGVQGMTPPLLCPAPLTMEKNSVVLLCSDGLTGMVDNTRIEHVISKAETTLPEKAARLVELANLQGGLDNITVQLVQYLGEDSVDHSLSKGKSSKKVWILGLILVLIIAIAAGGYYYFKKYKVDKEVKPVQKEQIDNRKTPAPQEISTQDVKEKNPNVDVVGNEKPVEVKTGNKTEKSDTNNKQKTSSKPNTNTDNAMKKLQSSLEGATDDGNDPENIIGNVERTNIKEGEGE